MTADFPFEIIEDTNTGELLISLPVLGKSLDGAYLEVVETGLKLHVADGTYLPLQPMSMDMMRKVARQENVLVAEADPEQGLVNGARVKVSR